MLGTELPRAGINLQAYINDAPHKGDWGKAQVETLR